MLQRPVAHQVTTDWRQSLPVLAGKQVVLRELRASDAASLFALLTTEEVARFISPPPTTVEGFERFIAWTLRQRAAGAYACFAVTVRGCDTAIGIFQLREMERGFGTAEWGFAIGSPFWGTGVFQDSAELVLEFVFGTLGVHRLEARAAVLNGRGIGALRKIGAVKEGVLRKSLERNGRVPRPGALRHPRHRLARIAVVDRRRRCSDELTAASIAPRDANSDNIPPRAAPRQVRAAAPSGSHRPALALCDGAMRAASAFESAKPCRRCPTRASPKCTGLISPASA